MSCVPVKYITAYLYVRIIIIIIVYSVCEYIGNIIWNTFLLLIVAKKMYS